MTERIVNGIKELLVAYAINEQSPSCAVCFLRHGESSRHGSYLCLRFPVTFLRKVAVVYRNVSAL